MNVHRDVIIDLLPLYLSGEASPGSRALVDRFLETDPELRAQLERGQLETGLDTVSADPGAGTEMRTLRRVRQLIAWQRWLFGFGLAATVIPLSSVFWTEGGQVHHRFLLAGVPGLMSASLSVAFWCWLFYWLVRRKLAAGAAA